MRSGALLLTCVVAIVVGKGHGGKGGKGGKNVCRGKDKNVYKEGEGYAEGCVTYTCQRLGRKVMSLVPSVVGACCELHGRGLFPAGEVIHDTGPDSCPRVRLSCELTPHDRPQVREEVLPGTCCHHRGASLAPGAKVAMAAKCAWLVCKEEAGGAWLELEVALEGCHCCLKGKVMVAEGSRWKRAGRRAQVCYRGDWLEQKSGDGTVEAMGQRVSWNSSLGVLTLEPREREEGRASTVFLFPSLGLRVVRGGERCLVTRLKESIQPEELLEGYREWAGEGGGKEERHVLQVTLHHNK